ncbi:MAG TPA: AbrB/MazE/SpoVT family DNA-binding domain-containing protein [Candidatus Bathyarchaeia archaeon]|nr:AbrB/MazE/SpoVT family DNA-binding domain-containing protein [Candidatus Bathyarchaeia archaeon]
MFWSIDWGETLTWQEQKLGARGQFVLPPEIMKALKLQPGDRVLFRLEGDKIIMTKVKLTSNTP